MIDFIKGWKSGPSSIDDLFQSDFLLNDKSQQVLLPYIRTTEELLNEAIKKYDPNGIAIVVPSFDLGFTYNTARLAGGFTTGMLVHWECQTPFVPIDMTIKECSGSIIEIVTNDKTGCFFSRLRIQKILDDLIKEGYLFNFNSGNHFISLFKNNSDQLFLVIHSGDDSYRDKNQGVYPSDDVWYKPFIKTLINNKRNRYLKYLVGSPATKFIDFSIQNRQNVHLFHEILSKRLMNGYGFVKSCRTYQHYGFYSRNTVLLGSGLVREKDLFPVFSNKNLPIVLVRPSNKMWALRIEGENRFLIPHGWGQIIKNIKDIDLSMSNTTLNLYFEEGKVIHEHIGYNKKLPKRIATIRDLPMYSSVIDGSMDFSAVWNNNLLCDIAEIFYPIDHFGDN